MNGLIPAIIRKNSIADLTKIQFMKQNIFVTNLDGHWQKRHQWEAESAFTSVSSIGESLTN